MDVIESVMRYLEGLGHATIDSTIFEGRMPSNPDEALAIRGTAGPEADRKFAYDLPTFQIMARGARGADPRPIKQWLKDIYLELHGFHGEMPGPLEVFDCWGIQSAPIDLGRDENNRIQYSINFGVEVRAPVGLRQ